MLTIFGDEVPLRAQVEVINGYSAHADRIELSSWIERVRDQSPQLSNVWLVHGEPPAQDELATAMRAKQFTVESPSPEERHTF